MSTETLEARILTGGQAVAEAMRQIDPDVVPAYPITPQTPMIQGYAAFVAQGRAHGELVDVESEHSAMSAAIGAALAGARTITATSSQGLALMAEVVYIAAAMRAPIVMAVGNRALSGPINIHCDHSDSMLIRDSGVVQLFAENAQEAYDLMVIAPRLAEHPDVLLPVLVCQDGFTITHSAEPVVLLEDDDVRTFVGEYRFRMRCSTSRGRRRKAHSRCRTTTSSCGISSSPRCKTRSLSSTSSPSSSGPCREGCIEASSRTRSTAPSMRSSASARAAAPSRTSVDELRRNGEKVGLLEVRSYPAISEGAVTMRCAACARVSVLDRADSPGGAPPLFAEVAAARRSATSSCAATSTGSAAATCIPRTSKRSSTMRSPVDTSA